jgi:hypothetical protein
LAKSQWVVGFSAVVFIILRIGRVKDFCGV